MSGSAAAADAKISQRQPVDHFFLRFSFKSRPILIQVFLADFATLGEVKQ
jgi:hypothetical protein